MIFRISLAVLIVLSLGVVGTLTYLSVYADITAPSPTPVAPQAVVIEAEALAQAEAALQAAVKQEQPDSPALALNQTQISAPHFSQDAAWAFAWLTPLDPDTGHPLPIEPGLALMEQIKGSWQVTLPSQPEWIDALLRAPADLVSEELKAEWRQIAMAAPGIQAMPMPSAALHGYRLPYAGGETMRVTQTVGHDRYTPSGSAHFSFDFAKPGYPSSMFNVHAAKAGVVTRVRWTQTNGSEDSPGNYVVLEDTTTTPTTYMLYLHLAQDSIPAELRIIGAQVQRGQFLGIADDTGVSSGNHLHFMVHTNAASYWGTAVDITFEDVSINGGRPRIATDKTYCKSSDVCDTFQTDYVSGNYYSTDSTPPTGAFTSVETGDSLVSPIVRLQGWALDEGSGLASASILARLNGSWQVIAGPFNQAMFTYDWDVCAAGVAQGPVDVALQLRDRANNTTPGLPGLTHLANNVVCPPPAPLCTPGPNQVAIFTEKDALGACALLNTGSLNLAALTEIGDNRVSSIVLGANLQATLYQDANQSGRAETFINSDYNLADNRIGKNSVSSIKVQTRGATPATPIVIFPSDGAVYTVRDPLRLSWNDGGGGVEFQARLRQGEATLQTTAWDEAVSWNLAALPAGTYTWQVRARQGSAESSWSAPRNLSIESAPPPPTPAINAPYTTNMDNSAPGWEGAGGWALTSAYNHTSGGGSAWQYTPAASGYNTGGPNLGVLTSPPVRLPAGSAYSLRFWELYETESAYAWYDQRWVQFAVDGGPFIDIVQLSDDPPNYWLQSPAYSLAAYAGKTVQVRFLFATLDAADNAHLGWFIDDITIGPETPPSCPGDSDNSPTQAGALTPGAAAQGVICPSGDIDYYVFQAEAGQTIGAWIEAAVNASPLDSILTLLDSDGGSPLIKNDDQVQYERPDSWLVYRVARSGTYYLKVNAWNHPSAGSPSHTYSLHLAQDATRPLGIFINPSSPLVSLPLTVRVQAQDAGSGIAFVRFLWHSSDWQGSDWQTLAEDWNSQDGWSAVINPIGQTSLAGGAIYVKIYDWAGNQMGLGQWNFTSPSLFLPVVIKGR